MQLSQPPLLWRLDSAAWPAPASAQLQSCREAPRVKRAVSAVPPRGGPLGAGLRQRLWPTGGRRRCPPANHRLEHCKRVAVGMPPCAAQVHHHVTFAPKYRSLRWPLPRQRGTGVQTQVSQSMTNGHARLLAAVSAAKADHFAAQA